MTKPRPTVSVVMIVKDEEAVLARALESVRWVDQIVVYDTGSTDRTVEIARQFSDTVITGYWDDDFGAARNRALAHATGEWILVLDADETFDSSPGALRKRLVGLAPGVYAMAVMNETSPLRAAEMTVGPRLFTRVDHRWEGRLHEQVRMADGSNAPGVSLLTGIQLRHTGYQVDVVLGRDKQERNLEVVQTQLAQALVSGDLAAIGEARVHLVRSLVFAQKLDEARANAEEAWASVHLPRLRGQLAQSMIGVELPARNLEAAQLWVDRWQETEPGMPAIGVLQARVWQVQGKYEQALHLLRGLPVETIAFDGSKFQRWNYAPLEVSLLHQLGRAEEALEVLRAAVSRGIRGFRSVEVLELFGAKRFLHAAESLPARVWRDWCQQCVERPSNAGLRVLTLLAQSRPEDLTPVVCASRLVPFMDFAQAGEWSARQRGLGLTEGCPLLIWAQDETRPVRERVLAAALVFSVYRDEQALPLLEAALSQVPAEEQDELENELAVVAPGLVVAT